MSHNMTALHLIYVACVACGMAAVTAAKEALRWVSEHARRPKGHPEDVFEMRGPSNRPDDSARGLHKIGAGDKGAAKGTLWRSL